MPTPPVSQAPAKEQWTSRGGPVAIEVRDVEKTFRIPTQRISRLKERLVNPFARQEYRQLDALQDVSFDIHRGEFFGIVGRNGSGKSTLLKIMASIYRADARRGEDGGPGRPVHRARGRIRHGADRAREHRAQRGDDGPHAEGGPREASTTCSSFAELEQFAELKLKNYSSGMLVRLAFSVMVQADTDILLIDEVLAVGDAAFQQKCADVFRRDAGAGQDDRPRHPRHGGGRALLPPGDAPRRRTAGRDRRPARGRAALPAPQLRAAVRAGGRDGRPRRRGRRRAAARHLARGRRRAAGDQRRAGPAVQDPGPAGGRPRRSRRPVRVHHRRPQRRQRAPVRRADRGQPRSGRRACRRPARHGRGRPREPARAGPLLPPHRGLAAPQPSTTSPSTSPTCSDSWSSAIGRRARSSSPSIEIHVEVRGG